MNKRILIVDDEAFARQRVARFLNEFGTFEIEEAHDGLEALERMERFKPDVVFLDVQMPGLTGFEVLEQLESKDFQIVFQTAYDEYAIQAFEQNACDYLLKPFSKDRFEKALSKALVRTLDADNLQASLKQLECTLREKKPYLERLTLKHGDKTKILSVHEIVCFVSKDHYTFASTTAGAEHIIGPSLDYLEGLLDPAQFFRCHRNNIAALAHIKSVGGSEDANIELANGTVLPLSRTKRPKVMEKLTQASLFNSKN